MTVEITLYNGAIVLVDEVDADLATMRWYMGSSGYATRTIAKCTRPMHRIILERIVGRPLTDGEETDHINRDKCDNRRGNLRLATRKENQRNIARHRNNTSGYKGVSLYKDKNKWGAFISVKNKTRYLGLYATPEAAARAYDAAARELHGEFAYQNFPHEVRP